ncbi:phage antirepressor KilAC domain-containing protein [Paraclostridium bifermentans]|uniref:phage antirepressor KilAC domain-containing protein n=1 Tax=Paraclostridium TaxID=1849822 RepID=UPI001CC72FFE|nr:MULTISPECIES: phage antirepressor KilAC domain-containing protein [Paraclostridium]MBZ6007563.1 phage antirepressor KilAC domain-containing protein [Paraclostridium bifermentans]MDU0298412.1 BRO family protein [Paraclostridium sp. MRS3W1]
MDNLQIFNNSEFGQIRVIEKEGKILAVGSDVAKSLGYSIPSKAVNTHCKGVSKMEVPTNGGTQEMLVITEGDIYRLISKSKLPSAEIFESWVFDDVLPQIRKTGGYIPTNEEEDETEILAKAVMIAQKTIEKKDELLKEKTRELEEKNKFINQIASSQNTLLVREVAKVISSKEGGIVIGEKKLYQKLRDWELIFKNKNEPQQRYIKQGLFELTEGVRNTSTGTFTYQTMRVTGKGQEYILNRLLKEEQINSQWA